MPARRNHGPLFIDEYACKATALARAKETLEKDLDLKVEILTTQQS